MSAEPPSLRRWPACPSRSGPGSSRWPPRCCPTCRTLPPAVRRVAAFAPARRARLGGQRDRRGARPTTSSASGSAVQVAAPPGAADDADDAGRSAARAWLTRPDGWAERRSPTRLRPDRGEPRRRSARTGELERLRERLADAEQARARAARPGSARGRLEPSTRPRTPRCGASSARPAPPSGRRRARGRAGARRELEAGARRGRGAGSRRWRRRTASCAARSSGATPRRVQARRDARAERDEATLRARLLLETVVDAATGLRRELALPAGRGRARPTGSRPTSPRPGARTPSSAGALGAGDPALLEQFLALPRARLIVDGYNVSKRAWPSSSLEAQRNRLLGGLAALVARTGAETTVVFDAAETDHRPPVVAPRGVRCSSARAGVIADDVIRDLVAVEPTGRVVRGRHQRPGGRRRRRPRRGAGGRPRRAARR